MYTVCNHNNLLENTGLYAHSTYCVLELICLKIPRWQKYRGFQPQMFTFEHCPNVLSLRCVASLNTLLSPLFTIRGHHRQQCLCLDPRIEIVVVVLIVTNVGAWIQNSRKNYRANVTADHNPVRDFCTANFKKLLIPHNQMSIFISFSNVNNSKINICAKVAETRMIHFVWNNVKAP